jgi:hypothetical protein
LGHTEGQHPDIATWRVWQDQQDAQIGPLLAELASFFHSQQKQSGGQGVGFRGRGGQHGYRQDILAARLSGTRINDMCQPATVGIEKLHAAAGRAQGKVV